MVGGFVQGVMENSGAAAIIISIALMLFAGFLMTRITKRLRLPNVTAYILTGSMVVETVFTTGGLGTKFVQGISNRDYPMIMGTTIFLATLMVTMTLISDLVYKLVDPRISFD